VRRSLTDQELVERFRGDPDGDRGREAVSELFRRYRDRVYLWCYRHMRDHDAAMDLAQETFIAAHRALPGYEGRSSVGSWLFSIARFRCASALRRPRLRMEEEVDLDSVPAVAPSPEEAWMESTQEDQVLAFLERHLDPMERTAFWLRAYEGATVEEITARLRPEEKSGARGVLQRARRKLRAALEREGIDGGRTE